MNTTPISTMMLERLEKMRMTAFERAEARAQILQSELLLDTFFGWIEQAATRGRRLKRRLRVFQYQQKRRHAHV
jgi:hypothetical protein